MLKEIVDAAQKKTEEDKNAIEKKFSLPPVGSTDTVSEEEPKKKTKKKAEVLPEGPDADNVLQEDTPEEEV